MREALRALQELIEGGARGQAPRIRGWPGSDSGRRLPGYRVKNRGTKRERTATLAVQTLGIHAGFR